MMMDDLCSLSTYDPAVLNWTGFLESFNEVFLIFYFSHEMSHHTDSSVEGRDGMKLRQSEITSILEEYPPLLSCYLFCY